jgi:hypothetical protein
MAMRMAAVTMPAVGIGSAATRARGAKTTMRRSPGCVLQGGRCVQGVCLINHKAPVGIARVKLPKLSAIMIRNHMC